jgi:hypothetical protein
MKRQSSESSSKERHRKTEKENNFVISYQFYDALHFNLKKCSIFEERIRWIRGDNSSKCLWERMQGSRILLAQIANHKLSLQIISHEARIAVHFRAKRNRSKGFQKPNLSAKSIPHKNMDAHRWFLLKSCSNCLSMWAIWKIRNI